MLQPLSFIDLSSDLSPSVFGVKVNGTDLYINFVMEIT